MNDGAFQTDRSGYPNNMRMIDFPGGWHERGANLSFADGHSEYWKWKDVRTSPLTAPGGNILLPRNPDLVRLLDAATSIR